MSRLVNTPNVSSISLQSKSSEFIEFCSTENARSWNFLEQLSSDLIIKEPFFYNCSGDYILTCSDLESLSRLADFANCDKFFALLLENLPCFLGY